MTRQPSRSRRTQRTYRRRRLTALLVLAVLVAGIAVAIAAGSGGGGSGRPGRATASAQDAAASASASTSAQSSGTTRTAPVARPASAPYRVGITSLTLDRPATTSTATGHAGSGAPIRTLPTLVRYPALGPADAGAHPGAAPAAGSGPFPLVVFSQGYDISAEAYSWLLDAWARAGYVVADPTYPLTDPATPEGVNEQDIVNHPADLRFVISAVLAAGRDPHSRLHGLIDPARVAIIGHSDGGDVSLAVADNSCCRDPRVKAAVILSGAELSAFGGEYYATGAVPLLVVQGSADTVNVPGCSAQIYDEAPRPRYYLNIAGAEHQPPYLDPGATRAGVARSVIAFLNAFLDHRTSDLSALVHHGTVTAGETITTAPLPPGTSTYCPGSP
jgi:alpha-beta hydrolase superfamily lysophospholipase